MLKDSVRNKDQGNLRWQDINWKDVTKQVSQLQSRIVKAEKEGHSDTAQRLKSLLLHSLSAKLLAVRQVVSNRGKRTADESSTGTRCVSQTNTRAFQREDGSWWFHGRSRL